MRHALKLNTESLYNPIKCLNQVRYTAMGMQGWRRTMEDSHIAHTDLDNGVSLFGVFDGHGGE